MVRIHENKILIGTFVGVCFLALAAATAAQAQSMSARGVDMSALKNQQANPCERKTKIHMPIHPYSDSDGCVGVVTLTQSGNDFNIGVSAAFKDETTFEGESVFEKGAKIGNAGSCTSSADAGTLRYNSSKSKIEFCDGSSFRDLDGPRGPQGPGGDRGPSGADGETTTVGSYTTSSWSACSESCGGGTQTRSVSCNSDSCTGSKPSTSRSCNTQDCAACDSRAGQSCVYDKTECTTDWAPWDMYAKSCCPRGHITDREGKTGAPCRLSAGGSQICEHEFTCTRMGEYDCNGNCIDGGPHACKQPTGPSHSRCYYNFADQYDCPRDGCY